MAEREPWRGGWAAPLVLGALLAGCSTLTPHKAPLIAVAPACQNFSITIYFEPRSAKVTHEARALFDASVKQAQGCIITHVRVTGLADAPGDPDANLELSRRRADAVTHLMTAHGWTNISFHVAAAGSAGAQTGSGEARPLRRRATIDFELTPRPVVQSK